MTNHFIACSGGKKWFSDELTCRLHFYTFFHDLDFEVCYRYPSSALGVEFVQCMSLVVLINPGVQDHL